MRRCQSKPGLAGCETSFQRARRAQVSVRTCQVTHSHGYTEAAALRKLMGMHGCRQLPATAGQCASDTTGTSARAHTSETQRLSLFLWPESAVKKHSPTEKSTEQSTALPRELLQPPLGTPEPLHPDPLRQVRKKSWQTEEMKYCSDGFRRTTLPC